jgi:NAD(P)-dependent dehydrogenase (short-subunit alcohol dehydrogenase family)
MVLGGLYLKATLPAPAATRAFDRELVRKLALEGGLCANPQSQSSDAPLLNLRVIVTGATSGLGREIASELYSLGATVVLACRSGTKAEGIIESIKSEFPQSKGTLDVGKTCEISSLQSVREYAAWYKAKYHGELHVLVNNAGIHYASCMRPSPLNKPALETVSPEGFDLAFATNYLGHFLLTRLLVETMVDTEKSSGKPGRIVNVASSYHLQSDGTMLAWTSSDVNEMPLAARSDIRTRAHRHKSYSNNKLAQVLHAKELQRRIDSGAFGPSVGLKAFSSCPAWASTSILPDNKGGNWVSSLAFSAKAGILGVLGAILDTRTFKGGEFVAVFQNEVSRQVWARPMMRLATRLGLRDGLTNLLGMWILFTQNRNYGYWSEPTSEEGEDAELAKSLFDWSLRATEEFCT